MKSEKKNWYDQFTKFFSKYCVVGLSLILISIIYKNGVEQFITMSFWKQFLSIVFALVDILGPSLLVASLFTYSIEAQSFMDYIKDNLEKVMIRKEFLDKLSAVDKQDALRRILSPNEDQFKIFSNIKNYFEETIEKDMKLFEYSFKSHFSIDVYASVKNGKVCMEETLNHRVYRGKNGFKPIKIGFEKSEAQLLFSEYVLPNGDNKKLKKEDFKYEEKVEESGFKWDLYEYQIPSTVINDYITVNTKTVEFGEDHWQLFSYKTILPSDGLKIVMNTSDELCVKEYMIFDNDRNYSCSLSEDKHRLEVYTSQWISPGNGINILVAKK